MTREELVELLTVERFTPLPSTRPEAPRRPRRRLPPALDVLPSVAARRAVLRSMDRPARADDLRAEHERTA